MARYKKKMTKLKEQILESAYQGRLMNTALRSLKDLIEKDDKNKDAYTEFFNVCSESYEKHFKEHIKLLQNCKFKLKLRKAEFLFPEKVRLNHGRESN